MSVSFDAVRAAVTTVLEAAGGRDIAPPIVMPAGVMIELCGETVRARLCTFTDPSGAEFCLRPDMTVPIARMSAEAGAKAERVHVVGPVFRYRAPGVDDPIEFIQAGFEWIGGSGCANEDAEAIALVLEGAAAAGVKRGVLRFGDAALFGAIVDALEAPEAWRRKLKKAYSRRRGPRDLMASSGDAPTRSPLAAGLAALEPSDAEAAVNEIFAIAGISAVGGRDASEIADRLIAQQQAGDSLPADTAAALTRFLDISGDAREAEKTLADFAKDVGVDINAALSRYVDRLDALKRLSPSLQADLVFGAEFGRRFDYYDGLVFELSHPAFPDDRAIAAGGRYDGLISELSRGDASATALGGVLRPDRLAIAAEADQ